MTDWSKHVHRFAKKHNMSYKQANRSRKCKETYKKRKTSPRRKMSPRRRRMSPRRKRRMNPPERIRYKNAPGPTDNAESLYHGALDTLEAANFAEDEYEKELEDYMKDLYADKEKINEMKEELKELTQRRISAANHADDLLKKLEEARRREGRRVVHL